ncbi:hypothetical protein [Weissella cibaria]|nr:hypothetical protein [Weissella cibaria]
MALEDRIDGAKDQVAGKSHDAFGEGKYAAEDVVEDIKEKFDKVIF